MERYVSSTILLQILDLRLLIARAGERDSMAWWNSYAMTEQGQWALKRLYPRYAAYAGACLAIKAAALVHAEVIGHRPAVTLFGLGTDLDARVTSQLDLRRMDDEPLTIAPPIRSPSELQARLSQTAGLANQDWVTIKSVAANSHLVKVGAVKREGLWLESELETITCRLAAAYTLSDLGHLVVPYYRLED